MEGLGKMFVDAVTSLISIFACYTISYTYPVA